MEVKCWAGDAMEELQKLPDGAVSLTIFSPPYPLKTERYPGARAKLRWDEWSEWMARIVAEATRVTAGFVIVNAKNPVDGGEELPATDWLRICARRLGCKMDRPVIWHKNSLPNKRAWWVNDWEPLFAFWRGSRPTTWNWEAVAKAPAYSSGGRFSHRESDGARKVDGSEYPQGKLARPRDVWRITVGGGHMGHRLATENEAPYPSGVVRPFVRVLTNPGELVLDPFAGSGTTLEVAVEEGRGAWGIDCRQSQVDLAIDRLLFPESLLRSRDRWLSAGRAELRKVAHERK